MTQQSLPLKEPQPGTLAWIKRKVETGYCIFEIEASIVETLRERYGEYLHTIGPDCEGRYAVSLHGLYSEQEPWTR